MTCWAIIPIKASAQSKSRLSGVLGARERQDLVRSMLSHVVETASASRMIDRVCLVGPSRLGLPETIPLLRDPGTGLNPAVQSAFAELANNGPDRVIVMAADLPEVTPQDLDLLAASPADTVAIAPDRHEIGTNAISLPLPAARDFRFAFGEDSFALHRAEAERIGLNIEVIFSRGLERDVDEPADLRDTGIDRGSD